MSAIDTLLRRNETHASNFAKGDLPTQPDMHVAVVTCMDTRIQTRAFLGVEEGEVHVIRNAGGIVTDDTVRSLVISQRLLGTREVMLVQHTGCGMLGFTDAELVDAIEREAGVRPPFPIGTFTDLERSLRDSIARLASSPFLPHRQAIRGFVYDVTTGRLREVE